MSEIIHIYKRPDVPHVFVWWGGPYIEVCPDYFWLSQYMTENFIGPVDAINVWDYENDVPRIHLEQQSHDDVSDFEWACVTWLVDNEVIPFAYRADEIDVDDLIDTEVMS
jgi:hypothetical protein